MLRLTMRIRILLLALVAAIVITSNAGRPVGAAPQSAPASPTEILWDTFGVPHIFAPDLTNALYAFGWAQMQSHGDLILRLYGQARGRGAEYWGAEYADSDRWVRKMGVPARAARWVKEQDAAMREPLDAFVAGINAFAKTHGDRLAGNVKVVLPIAVEDVLAHAQRVIHFTFLANPQQIDAQGRRWSDAG